MSYGRTIRRIVRCTLSVGMITLLAGCAVGLDRLPMPAISTGSQSYSLTAIFANALNLPAKAKVRLFGADIGEVESITAENFTADVTMRIRSDVPLHVGATAELRSATVLGDIFIQIRPGAHQELDAAVLHDGATIPLTSTAAAPTVEDLLDSMALLINGGAVRYLVSVVNGAGRAVGGRGEKVDILLQQSRELLSRMTARSKQLDIALRRTAELAGTMSERRDTLDRSLTAGASAMAVIADDTTRLADLADAAARITRQLARFPSVQGTDTRSTIADIDRLAAVLNDIAVDPNLSLYPLNRLIGIMMHSTSSTALHGTADLAKLSLVPWPDKNYPGDPEFHWPDGTDWHLMVGSLRYEWNLVLDKIYGAQRWNPAAPQ